MLEHIMTRTNEYINTMPKSERKKYGQFFTSVETARYMSSLYCINQYNRSISILDTGAGSGILSCALIERLDTETNIESVRLTCYENDINIIELLNSNLQYMMEHTRIDVQVEIVQENYITSQEMEFNNRLTIDQEDSKFDLVIGNPPYLKINKEAPEALAMPEVCYGAPNMYFLFAAMALYNLKTDGEMVYIIPRSWTSGAYFKKFREYLLSNGKLEHIHLFVSRDRVFDAEAVLQETMIIKVKKTKEQPVNLIITSTDSNNDFHNIREMTVPYDIVVTGENLYVYLITSESEMNVLNILHRWNQTLISNGLKMKTGLTVDFRNRELLSNTETKDSIPLFYSQNIKDGKIAFPVERENQYIVTTKAGLMQENINYLFVKRFTSKEESRRLQCGIYIANEFPMYDMISTQNKINFITGISTPLTSELAYGLYVIFNSTLYDMYYRILNGSTQVNSTEINSMPIPSIDIIREMGIELQGSNQLDVEMCDSILQHYIEI